MTKATKADKALATLEAQIADTIQHWTKARDGVQASLVGILSHVHMTENQDHAARLTNMLLDGLGDGINGNAIREWAGKHMNMIMNKEQKLVCRKFDLTKFSKTAVASKENWYSLRIQKPTMFNLDAQIVALLKKAEKAAEKSPDALVEGSKIEVGEDALKALREIAAASVTRLENSKASQKTQEAGSDPLVGSMPETL